MTLLAEDFNQQKTLTAYLKGTAQPQVTKLTSSQGGPEPSGWTETFAEDLRTFPVRTEKHQIGVVEVRKEIRAPLHRAQPRPAKAYEEHASSAPIGTPPVVHFLVIKKTGGFG